MRMTIVTLLFLITFNSLFASEESSLKDQVEILLNLIKSNPDSAYIFSENLLKKANAIQDEYAIVKANYYTGYLYRKEGLYNKAIIHYLEAISIAKKTSYKGVENDLIALYKNAGVIFHITQTFDLSKEYYNEAIELAKKHNLKKQINGININFSILYKDLGEIDRSIELLNTTLIQMSNKSRAYFVAMNALGLRYYDKGDYQKAIAIHKNLINELPSDSHRLTGFAHNNIAESFKELNMSDSAIHHYRKSIATFSLDNKNSLQVSPFKELGEIYLQRKDYKAAKKILDMAESNLNNFEEKGSFYEVYKLQAKLHNQLGDSIATNYYKSLYKKEFAIQKQKEDSQVRYNMNLISQRYLAQIEKEEKTSTLYFYSKLALLGILLILIISVTIKLKISRNIYHEK